MYPQKQDPGRSEGLYPFAVWYVLVFVLLISSIAFAGPQKTVYSRSSPSNWTTNTHWSSTSGGGSCACTPDESKDFMYIETTTNSAAGLTFGSSATLTVRNNSTFTINGDVTFTNGSIIVVEAGSSLIITGNLINNNNSNQVTINGGISVGGNFDGGNGSAILGAGTMSVTGTATTTGSATVFGSNGSCSGCEISPSNPLPVELLFFNASSLSNSVFLEWSTAAEFNSDHFIVQRSADGHIYENITQLDAAGNSNTVINYSADDKEPYSGVSFYRLKQVDNDGKFKFSDIVVVKFQQNDLIAVYPNPTSGAFNVDMKAGQGDEVLIVVRDVLGKEYYSNVIVMENNVQVVAVDPEHKLAPGIYIIVATSRDEIYEKKLVVK